MYLATEIPRSLPYLISPYQRSLALIGVRKRVRREDRSANQLRWTASPIGDEPMGRNVGDGAERGDSNHQIYGCLHVLQLRSRQVPE